MKWFSKHLETDHGSVVAVERFVEIVHLNGDADDQVSDADVGEAVGEVVGLAGNRVDKSDAHAFHGHHAEAAN